MASARRKKDSALIARVEAEKQAKAPRTLGIHDMRTVNPLTEAQTEFFRLWDHETEALLLHGVAGTGKTYIALAAALVDVLTPHTDQNQVIVVRSAVPSRDIGHLPGDEKQKTEVYTQPYVDICASLFPKHGGKAYEKLSADGKIKFLSTSYVRGITLDNAIVVVDEFQNLNFAELNTIITRLGHNSRLILCGDYRQTDLNKKHDQSGLKKLVQIISHMPMFKEVEFGVEDIVRGSLCREWIIAQLLVEDLTY